MGDTQLAIYGTRASFKTSLSSLKSDVLTYGKRGDRCRLPRAFPRSFWGGMNVPDIFSPPFGKFKFSIFSKIIARNDGDHDDNGGSDGGSFPLM